MMQEHPVPLEAQMTNTVGGGKGLMSEKFDTDIVGEPKTDIDGEPGTDSSEVTDKTSV